MITKEQLIQLRQNRAQPNARLEYNIDGPTHTHVISSIEAERERQITLGERAMQDALRDMRREYALSRNDGLARVSFNHTTTTERKP